MRSLCVEQILKIISEGTSTAITDKQMEHCCELITARQMEHVN